MERWSTWSSTPLIRPPVTTAPPPTAVLGSSYVPTTSTSTTATAPSAFPTMASGAIPASLGGVSVEAIMVVGLLVALIVVIVVTRRN